MDKPLTLTPAELAWIDTASYADLLARWRYGRKGEVWFAGSNGQYYKQKIEERKQELMPFEAEAIEKKIGWGKGQFWTNLDNGKEGTEL